MTLLLVSITSIFLGTFAHTPEPFQDDRATTVPLQTLEGDTCTLWIGYDHVDRNVLTVGLGGRDSVCMSDFGDWNMSEDVRVLGKRFLQVEFNWRGGTNEAYIRCALICVSEGRIYKTLDMISYSDSRLTETYVPRIDSLHMLDEETEYQVDFSSITEQGRGYELTAVIHDFVKSKRDPSTAHDLHDTLRFVFDGEENVFYTQIAELGGEYTVESDFSRKPRTEFFNGRKVPAIILSNGDKLFYDKQRWLYFGSDYCPPSYLIEFSRDCR